MMDTLLSRQMSMQSWLVVSTHSKNISPIKLDDFLKIRGWE